MVSDVAEPLYHDGFAGQSGRQAKRFHIFDNRACLANPEENASPGGFPPPANPVQFNRFPCHTGNRIKFIRCHAPIGIQYPCHFGFAGAEVRSRHVYARADVVFLNELVGIAARDAFQFACGVVSPVQLNPTFRTAKRHIDKRAFVSHQRRQCHNLVFIHEGTVADTAFRRQFMMAMFGAPAVQRLNRAIVTLNRERHMTDAIANLNLL